MSTCPTEEPLPLTETPVAATAIQAEPKINGAVHFPMGHLGDLAILEELGHGRSARVFKARERSLNRVVAVKVLNPGTMSPTDSLIRKASFKHDHVVTLYRVEKPTGFPPYLVMEYVEGETLESRMRREGKLAPEAAANIARQAALGLAALRARGLVHGGLKPSNILLDERTGRAKIGDIDLAGATGDGEYDGRADLFSLGSVLYQMLTGQAPFDETSPQQRTGILELDPIKTRRLRTAIPSELETITLTCLERDPQRRYGTAQALAEDLRRFLSREPILCRPTGPVARAVQWAVGKRGPTALVGATCLAAAALVGLVVALVFSVQLQSVNADLAKTKNDLQDAKAKVVDQESYGRRLNYVADMNLAHQAWQSDNHRVLNQLLDAPRDAKLRGFEWHYLRWLAKAEGRRIGPKDPITAVAFDPSGRLLALGVLLGKAGTVQVQVWKSPTPDQPLGELLYSLDGHENVVKSVVFHPKKDLLISADRGGEIRFWDYKNGKRVRMLEGSVPLAVSPNGQILAYVRSDGRMQRWSFATERDIGGAVGSPEANIVGAPGEFAKNKGKVNFGDILKGFGKSRPGETAKTKPKAPDPEPPAKEIPQDSYDGPPIGFEQLAFSPDSQRLAAVGGHYKNSGFASLWDLKSGQLRRLEDAKHADLLTGVAFSPDGQSLAAAGADHALRVWDTTNGKLRFRRAAHQLEMLCVAYNFKGDRLATTGADQAIKIWNARTGEELRSLHGNHGIVRQIAFCPHANQPGQEDLVSLNEQGELSWWNAEQEQTAHVFRHTAPVVALAFNTDGRFLSSVGQNSHVLIQDLVNKDRRYELASNSNVARGIFNQDGKSLLTLSNDSIVKAWHFEKSKSLVYQPKGENLNENIWFVNQRVLVRKEQQFWMSQAYPSIEESLENLMAFGNAPAWDPAVLAVDAAGERLALALNSGLIVLRHRAPGSAAVSDKIMRSADAKKANHPAVKVNALAFSPDGRYLAAGCQDNSIQLWDTQTGTVQHQLMGHLSFVSCVAFSPDGKRLVSGSEDWTVKVWDIDVGRATLTLRGHKGRIRDLAFRPDGKYLTSASEDGTVRLWPGISDEPRGESQEAKSL